jgi:uncharacterized protein YajQ (UPF0234 family)
MPSFDVVSEVDRQELRNAVDQAQREMSQRFDFKGTNSEIEQNELVITIRTISEDKARAVRTLLEEKFVKRGLSLKGIEWGKFEQASGDSIRQVVTIKVGISSDKAKEINKMIKEKGPKGMSSQTQGDQVRVTSKKRDDLQEVMTMLKGADLGIPLQFENFRDYSSQSSDGVSEARFCNSVTTLASASVVVSPRLRPSATSRSNRRMIFPERVLGRSGVK